MVNKMLESFQRERDILMRITLYQAELAARLRLDNSNGDLKLESKDIDAQGALCQTRNEKLQQVKTAMMDMVGQISLLLDYEASAKSQNALGQKRGEEEEKSVHSCETKQTNRSDEQLQRDRMVTEAQEESSNSQSVKQEELREREQEPKQTEEAKEADEADSNTNESRRVPRVNRKESQGFKNTNETYNEQKGCVKLSRKVTKFYLSRLELLTIDI